MDVVALPISHIINLNFEKSSFPAAWKIAKIIPLPKNSKEAFSGKNSRPISILPTLSKIMESIVYEQVQDYFSRNNLNTAQQHAYRKGHSTATALTQMTDNWLREIDAGELVGAVLLDFSAAFDILDHGLLVNKLCCYGFDSHSIDWFRSYLANRKYCVYFNGGYSEMKDLSCGVPQGSCLGPLLFSIFTNDLPLILNRASIAMYADDSTIHSASFIAGDLENVLNEELLLIKRWVNTNKLVLNLDKTKSIVLWDRRAKGVEPKLQLKLDDKTIEQVTEVKLLGVMIDCRMNWTTQINVILKKMGRGIAAIKHCRQYLPGYLVKQLMETLVLSQLDYCTVIWSNTSENNLTRLQIAQNKAARIVLNCSYRAIVSQMLDRLNWLPVKDRLHYSLLAFIRNIIITKSPVNIYNTLTFSCDRHSYSTRLSSDQKFLLPAYRIDAGQRTLHYRAMVAWNDLPNFLVNESSKSAFKTKLKLYMFTRHVMLC